MSSLTKLSENEMNYYQFKAKQLFQLKKENHEWSNYCKKVLPDCAACSAELIESQTSKTVGIQVSPRKPSYLINKQPPTSSNQELQLPEALNNIRMKLENIDLALSKMYEPSQETEKTTTKQEDIPVHSNEPTHMKKFAQFREQRKLLIQNSIKSTLEKIHNLSTVKPQTSSRPIKNINSGFFIPHQLQVKRAAARRAYLSSLQTKPKVLARPVLQTNKKLPQKYPVKKVSSKSGINERKKPVSKAKALKENLIKQAEETLIKSLSDDENKDDNIEQAVDGILDDLLGEAVLDLNRMRQLKINKQITQIVKSNFNENPEDKSTKITSLENIAHQNVSSNKETGVTKLKSFLNPSYTVAKEYKSTGAESSDTNNTNPPPTEVPAPVNQDPDRTFVKSHPLITLPETKISPKFVCAVSHVISIDPVKAKEISYHRKKFWRYLREIGRTSKGNYNPWTLSNVIAESILDDCIQDVAEELSNLPATLVKDMYNQEFLQQVE